MCTLSHIFLMHSAIIILADEQKPDQSDARLIHVVLSLMVMHKELQQEGKGGIKVRDTYVSSACL